MNGANNTHEKSFRPEEGLRGLDRNGALLALRVRSFVKEELGVDWQGKRLLLAFSGGLDSTALLCLLLALRPLERFHVFAAHLDHGLRPESGQDAAHVRRLCAAWGVPLHEHKENIRIWAKQEGTGEEEAGRTARRMFLRETAKAVQADWVLLAHHADDLAEDILMRLIRGTGWPALGGMRGCDPTSALPLLRPLLMEEKSTLRSLLERHGIPWREDATNSERIGRRNRIRLDVMPLLKAENPSFLDSARRLWRSARQDELFWLAHLEELFEKAEPADGDGILLRREFLQNLPESVRLRWYLHVLDSLRNSQNVGSRGGQNRHSVLLALDRALREKRHDRRFQFGGGLEAELFPGGLVFRRVRPDRT